MVGSYWEGEGWGAGGSGDRYLGQAVPKVIDTIIVKLDDFKHFYYILYGGKIA